MEDILSVFSAIINIILLIVFAVMASNVGTIKRKISWFLEAYSKETGIGRTYKCGSCKKEFSGKQEKCPHCQANTGL